MCTDTGAGTIQQVWEAEVCAAAGAGTERMVVNSPRIQAVAALQGPWSSWSKATLCVQEHSLQEARSKYANSPFLSRSSCSLSEDVLDFKKFSW